MSIAWHYFLLSTPLFAIILLGYLVSLWRGWQNRWTVIASNLVFTVALPALLFDLMSKQSSMPQVDPRLLLAFFGGCLIVFVIGRLVAARLFKLDGVAQSVFALGGIFSNNVLLGLPFAQLTLGVDSLPSVALVIIFNALILWTLVTVSVEWARHGSFTAHGLGRTTLSVLTNPLVAAILIGTLFGLSGLQLPPLIRLPLHALAQLAAPAALLVLGMGLRAYGVRQGWQASMSVTVLKLVIHPLVVWCLAVLLGLPAMETSVVVLLASMSIGANVYLMAIQFQTLEGTVASGLVLSTALAAITTPLILALVAALR